MRHFISSADTLMRMREGFAEVHRVAGIYRGRVKPGSCVVSSDPIAAHCSGLAWGRGNPSPEVNYGECQPEGRSVASQTSIWGTSELCHRRPPPRRS